MAEKDCYRDHYDWSEFVDQASKRTTTEPSDDLASRRPGDKWHGASWSEALNMARTDGYRDAIPEADRFSQAVSDTIITERLATTFEPVWEVTGSEVDMGRYLSGLPENMIEATPMRISRAGRAVRIAVPVAYRYNISADVIMRRGAAVMALVDVLARAQHPLEIWAGCAVAPTYRRIGLRGVTMVKVQEANAPLDMGRIMFALAHPTMLRRLIFSLQEQKSQTIRQRFGFTSNGGYGMPQGLEPSDLPDDQGGNTIILPMLDNGQPWDAKSAVAWIEETLATIFGED